MTPTAAYDDIPDSRRDPEGISGRPSFESVKSVWDETLGCEQTTQQGHPLPASSSLAYQPPWLRAGINVWEAHERVEAAGHATPAIAGFRTLRRVPSGVRQRGRRLPDYAAVAAALHLVRDEGGDGSQCQLEMAPV